MLSISERETPQLLMGTSEFDGYGKRKKDYYKVRFAEGVVTGVWEISLRRTDLEGKYCFNSRSDFGRFRDNSDRKENCRHQELA